MSGNTARINRPVDILLRKLMLFGSIGLLGLLAGLIGWPVIQAEILVRKLDDRNNSARIEAMNDLAPIAVSSSAYLTPLLNAVLDEPKRGNADSVALADEVAVWVLKRSTSAQKKTEQLLESSDDQRFLHLSDLMVKAGLWNRQPRTLRFRREWVRMHSDDPGVRIAGYRKLVSVGIPDSTFILTPGEMKVYPVILKNMIVSRILDDPDIDVRCEALGPLAKIDPQKVNCLLFDTAEAVRQHAALWIGTMQIPIAEQFFEYFDNEDAGTKHAAWWAFSRVDYPDSISFPFDDRIVVPMAVWTYGKRGLPLQSDWINAMPEEDFPLLNWRYCVALGRTKHMTPELAKRFAESEDAEQYIPALLISLGRSDSSDEAADWVAARIEEGLQKGIETWVAAGCQALGEMGNTRAIPLLQGLIDELSTQPLVQWSAVRALLKLDRQDGIDALFELLEHEDDLAGDLAVWTLGMEVDPVSDDWSRRGEQNGLGQYRSELVTALWLARGKGMSVDIAKQLDYLRMKTVDKTSPEFESDWKPHGYYLCARLLLGDTEARAALEPFISNPAFPRFALFASLLCSGDTVPYDLILNNWSVEEAESFLCNTRFIEVVQQLSPDTPAFEWFEDPEIRVWQTQRMRDWWWLRQDRPATRVLRSLRDNQPAVSD